LRQTWLRCQAAKATKEGADQLHGQDYLVYAICQQGQDKAAHAVVDEIEAAQSDPDSFAGAFSRAAAPARYAVDAATGRPRPISASSQASFST